MPKPKRKAAYDLNDPQDNADYQLLRQAGMAVDRRYPRSQLEALRAMPIEQLKRGGVSFHTDRKKLEGSEVREVESTAAQRHIIPKCLWWLSEGSCSALDDYMALWEMAKPSETVSLQPRMSGGSMSSNPYEGKDDAMQAWRRARAQMARNEAKIIEMYLLSSDDALVSQAHGFAIRSGAAKLEEFFSENNLVV